MKKNDFKKMALLGMTGGMLLSSQAQVSAEIATSGVILAHKCGANSCNSNRSPQPTTNSCAAHSANPTADSDKALPTMTTGHKAITESDLMSHLNDEGKKAFAGLDAEGKALALKLANEQAPGQNKNDAVQAAAKQMADKRAKANSSK
jgi:hypothetical protein